MPHSPPADPADHAEDFSRRYREDLDIAAGQAMMDLDIPGDKMGAGDPDRFGEHHSFHPGDRTGGSVSPDGRITVDSGVMNPHLLDEAFDNRTREMWRRTCRSASRREPCSSRWSGDGSADESVGVRP